MLFLFVVILSMLKITKSANRASKDELLSAWHEPK
jgi:hypothetical protein